MDVQVVSPEALLYEGEATEVYARSVDGEIGILAGHQPVLLLLAPAPLKVKGPDGERVFAVASGFLEFADNQLTVLADRGREVASVEEAHAVLEEL